MRARNGYTHNFFAVAAFVISIVASSRLYLFPSTTLRFFSFIINIGRHPVFCRCINTCTLLASSLTAVGIKIQKILWVANEKSVMMSTAAAPAAVDIIHTLDINNNNSGKKMRCEAGKREAKPTKRHIVIGSGKTTWICCCSCRYCYCAANTKHIFLREMIETS